MIHEKFTNPYAADCSTCFGLCCVALPFGKSADFPFDKEGGSPCKNLQNDFRCGIHSDLRGKGFRGCTVYECFGAGQKVSQEMYEGKDWRQNLSIKSEMFTIFPIVQQLHEMLYYIEEALQREETKSIHQHLRSAKDATERLTLQSAKHLLTLNVASHRSVVNEWLLKASELVRVTVKPAPKPKQGGMLIGAKLKGANLKGSNLRGSLMIAADLRNADLSYSDFIGVDIRDADLSGANLTGCIFLTQAQINSANGDRFTKLPAAFHMPNHWLK